MIGWEQILHSAWFHGGVTGLVAAAGVDVHAFATWKRFNDVATYDWSTAAFRWVQGFILGAIAWAGYGALVG